MARLEANLEVKTGNGNDYSCTMSDQFTEVVTTTQIVNNNDTYTQIAVFGTQTDIGGSVGARLAGSKLVVVKNKSDVSVELEFAVCDWKNDSNIDQANSVDLGPDSATTIRQFSYLLAGNEYIILPSQWMVSYAEGHSAANAKTINNLAAFEAHSGNMWVDSVANLGEDLDATETTVPVDDSDYFVKGDLIQLGTTTNTAATKIEIMRIISITNATTIEVERAVYGSNAGVSGTQTTGHVNSAAIYFPFFNTQNRYDKYPF